MDAPAIPPPTTQTSQSIIFLSHPPLTGVFDKLRPIGSVYDNDIRFINERGQQQYAGIHGCALERDQSLRAAAARCVEFRRGGSLGTRGAPRGRDRGHVHM